MHQLKCNQEPFDIRFQNFNITVQYKFLFSGGTSNNNNNNNNNNMNMNMNMNENMNGRKRSIKRREIMESANKTEIISKFSNFPLAKDFKPQILQNFQQTFKECKTGFETSLMDKSCEEEFVIVAWKNLRNFLKSDYPTENICEIEDGESPLSNFASQYIR